MAGELIFLYLAITSGSEFAHHESRVLAADAKDRPDETTTLYDICTRWLEITGSHTYWKFKQQLCLLSRHLDNSLELALINSSKLERRLLARQHLGDSLEFCILGSSQLERSPQQLFVFPRCLLEFADQQLCDPLRLRLFLSSPLKLLVSCFAFLFKLTHHQLCSTFELGSILHSSASVSFSVRSSSSSVLRSTPRIIIHGSIKVLCSTYFRARAPAQQLGPFHLDHGVILCAAHQQCRNVFPLMWTTRKETETESNAQTHAAINSLFSHADPIDILVACRARPGG
ncbi:hypothetical protein C8R43DRAFT_1127284 [Mycena crocata]|nr:hypothetical protein C8R43DRAFT_1127284 [Mycena crocata]